jgi:hypothetical protein
MVKRSIGILGIFAIGLFFAAAAPGQTSHTASESGSATPDVLQADVQDKDIYCPDAIETFLPGDYYACKARAFSGRGKYRQMMLMLEESASWANKDAQYVLGLAYFNGDMPDVPQNRPLGLAWLALAEERKNPQYQLAYAAAHAKATPEEIHKASMLWQQMRTKYGDSVAAPRAVRRFNHAIAPIDESAFVGGTVYLHGYSFYPESAFSVANRLHDEASADFDDWHGQVVVGRPEMLRTAPWLRTTSQSVPPTAGSVQP